MKRKIFLFTTILMSLFFILGCASLVLVPNTKKSSQVTLQKELTKNSQRLKKQTMSNTAGSLTAIGDSVMLGAAPALQKQFPHSVIDAKESRQVVQASDIVEKLSEQNNLGEKVVIALGTNSPFSLETGQALIDQLKGHEIFWITTYGKHLQWQDDSNRVITKLASQNKNVKLVRWDQEAPKHPEWFYDDGIHLNITGQVGYAKYLATIVN